MGIGATQIMDYDFKIECEYFIQTLRINPVFKSNTNKEAVDIS